MSDFSSRRTGESRFDWLKNYRPFYMSIALIATMTMLAGCSHIRDVVDPDSNDSFTLTVDEDARLQFDDDDAVASPRTDELQPILDQVEALFRKNGERPVSLAIVSKGSTFIDVCYFVAAAGQRQCVRITLP